MSSHPPTSPKRLRLTVSGVVQGVGFRPYIYGLALQHELAGFVGNDSGGVFIEVEGPQAALDRFQEALIPNQPPLAYIEKVTAQEMPLQGKSQFAIVHSQAQEARQTLISPDICICDDCLREMLDPQNRRLGYPFINCTNCGPRFTIIKDIPYDRPLTTMAPFIMCDLCRAEYEDPLDRRFHAQPNACPDCGPNVWLESASDPGRHLAERQSALRLARQMLSQGRILAVKGLGGFHLACDAANDQAVALLRQRKGRGQKPLALMTFDAAAAGAFTLMSEEEETLLMSKERPIVILQKHPDFDLSDHIAPGNGTVGVMLPYTPLHYLLLQPLSSEESPQVLVMTSGNYSDEPIIKDNERARQRLAHIADAFLMHDRQIHARCDDSVLRLLPNQRSTMPAKPQIVPIRRSRGYAPFPVKLPFSVPPILAVGGELKSTFCLANEQYAYLSQHIGDLENLETLQALQTAVDHYQHIFRIEPQIIACDLHPRYLASRWAEEQAGTRPLIQVQHHHAHIASLMAEKGLDGSHPVIGFSFDGTGYGPDQTIWGGEVLIADYHQYQRAYYLSPMPLAGGDAAVKRPYRLALAYLYQGGRSWDEDLAPVRACPPQERKVLRRQLETGLNVVPTSSMGRLFDVVASLIGLRQEVTFEGQAAIELESIAGQSETIYPIELRDKEITITPILQAILHDLTQGRSKATISARFHATIAHMIVHISRRIKNDTGINTVALSGGVFQNMLLLQQTVQLLNDGGFETYHHALVPANDGGLALGQAVIAAAAHEHNSNME